MSKSIVGHAMRAAALVAVIASTTHAQQPVSKDQPPAGGQGMGRGMGGQRMLQVMKDSLQLTDAQYAKVDSIMQAYRAKMPAYTPGQPPSDEDRATRMKLMQEQSAAIKAVLTPEQATKYDAMMAAMRSRMGGGRPPAGA
jgi:periplasmic protein CpxP/Spy